MKSEANIIIKTQANSITIFPPSLPPSLPIFSGTAARTSELAATRGKRSC